MTRFIAISLTVCVRFLAHFPLRWLHAAGAPLGWLVYGASTSYRRRFQATVAQAGGPWSPARGANAVVGLRFVTSEIAAGCAELLAYGTAVRIE